MGRGIRGRTRIESATTTTTTIEGRKESVGVFTPHCGPLLILILIIRERKIYYIQQHHYHQFCLMILLELGSRILEETLLERFNATYVKERENNLRCHR
jgi:hypothetical protein